MLSSPLTLDLANDMTVPFAVTSRSVPSLAVTTALRKYQSFYIVVIYIMYGMHLFYVLHINYDDVCVQLFG